MARHLVLVGGGHAHMTVMLRLAELVRRGHRVTLVSPAPYHYYSGMGPGMLGGSYRPAEVRFDVARMVTARGGAFVAAAVTAVDPVARRLTLAGGSALDYDVASFNVGSRIAIGAGFVPGARVIPVKPVANLLRVRPLLEQAPAAEPLNLAVIGGGPAGVEIAGNLQRLLAGLGRAGAVTLVAGRELLAGFPERVRQLVRADFAARGIRVREGVRATAASDGRVTLDDGSALPAALTLLATGVEPEPLFAASGLPTGADGGLLVNRFLQCERHPELFGGGDCISFAARPLAKVGVYAVRQNPVLLHNLRAALEDRPLQAFVPQARFLLVFNLGDGRGVLHYRGRAADGRASFWFKDWLDRRFMRRFQVSKETATEE